MSEYQQSVTTIRHSATTSQVVAPRRRNSNRPGLRQWLLTAAGVVAGLIVVEVGLYPFIASYSWPKTSVRTVRAYNEGIAESHFVPDDFGTYGRRLTGNKPIPGAPTIVIVGDSHVVQDAVRDE